MSKVTAKGQVTIPKEVREKLGIHPGDDVEFKERDGVVVLKKATDNPFERWRGVADESRSVDERMRELRGDRGK